MPAIWRARSRGAFQTSQDHTWRSRILVDIDSKVPGIESKSAQPAWPINECLEVSAICPGYSENRGRRRRRGSAAAKTRWISEVGIIGNSFHVCRVFFLVVVDDSEPNSRIGRVFFTAIRILLCHVSKWHSRGLATQWHPSYITPLHLTTTHQQFFFTPYHKPPSSKEDLLMIRPITMH